MTGDREQFRWIGLTRVSTVGQVEAGGGLETQRARIEQWVRRRGDRLVTVLSDAGVSGTVDHVDERLALAEAFHMLNRNEADGIVVSRLDRLGRDLMMQEVALAEVRRMDCLLASCEEAENQSLENDSDPTAHMFRQLLGVFAEWDRRMLVAKVQAGRRRKAAEGGYIGTQVPYGYEPDGHGNLREVAHEIDAIAQALTMRELGATYAVIAELFVQSGVRLKRGTHWHSESVKRVLTRAREQGYPKPAPLNNLSKLVMGLPTDAFAV